MSVKYQYDADGQRVKDSTGSTVRQYLIDPLLPYGQVIAETDGSNTLVAEYVYGQDRVSLRKSGAAHYYLADGQGSTRLLTDSTGTATDSTVYTAFGETLFSSGSTPNAYLYTGEKIDGGAGLYNLRARLMDPKTGRFTSVDKADGCVYCPLSLHKYLYAEDSPVWKSDPSGLSALAEVLATISVSNILAAMPRGQGVLIYSLYLRLFAPWETFGYGFGGDLRSFTTSLNVTSRVTGSIVFDVRSGRQFSKRAWSDASEWGAFTGIASPTIISGRGLSSNSLLADLAGANPLVPGAPDIDAHLDMSWKIKENGQVCFDGALSGDAFPNAEVFVVRGGKGTMLHTFSTEGGRNNGPFEYLPGDNHRSMGNFTNKCAR